MSNKIIKVYADTSVFGGVFDSEFSEASQLFFDLVRNNKFTLAISPVVEAEITKAPGKFRIYLGKC